MKTALRYKWRAEISSKKVSACGDVVSCDFSFCYRPNVANGLSESIPLMGPGVYGYFVTPLHDMKSSIIHAGLTEKCRGWFGRCQSVVWGTAASKN